MRYALVLVEDPGTNHGFDLAAAVRRSRRARLAVVAEAAAREPGAAGDRFRVRQPGREATGTPAVPAADALAAVLQKAGSALVVVGVVSPGTMPLWEALHGDPRTQAAPRIGITTHHLDADWNLAQKLLADGKLSVHEHTQTLERVLGRRIDLLLARHASRSVPGAAGD